MGIESLPKRHAYQLQFKQWMVSIYIHILCIKGLDLQTRASTSFETCRSVISVTNYANGVPFRLIMSTPEANINHTGTDITE
jgi:hypothetical protein